MHPGIPRPPCPALREAPTCHRKVQQEALEWYQPRSSVHLIMGYPFIGSYTARFHPRRPQHCPECGAIPLTVGHVIQLCLRFARARATYLAPAAPDLSSSSLFGMKEGGEALIKVLEVTEACFRPHEQAFDPG